MNSGNQSKEDEDDDSDNSDEVSHTARLIYRHLSHKE